MPDRFGSNCRSNYWYVMVLLCCSFFYLVGCGAKPYSTPESLKAMITYQSSSMALGQAMELKFLVMRDDGSYEDQTQAAVWLSTNEGVVKAGTAGHMQSKGVGTTVVSAVIGGFSASIPLRVTAAAPVSLAVVPATASLALGGAQQLAAIESYTDGTTQDVTSTATWTASTPEVAPVSGDGVAVGKAIGSSVVTAQVGSEQATSALTVTPASLVSITVHAAKAELALGLTQQFTATGRYSDGSTQDLTSAATWASSAPDVASVNNAGLVSGKGVGGSMISAAIGSVQSSAPLAVTPAALASLTVSASKVQISLGLTEQFSAVGTYTDGSTQDVTRTAVWKSSAPDVALVSGPGTLSGKAVGTSIVTAQLDSVQASSPLTVTPAALVSIALNTAKAQMALGLTQQLSVVGTYTDGSTQDVTAKATWKSSAPDVAPVSGSGLLSAKAVGASVVTAQVDSVQSSAPVAVTEAALVSLAVNAVKPQLALGLSQQLTAVGTYTDGSTRDVTSSALWKSSAPEVVSVESTGVVAAKAVGASVVTARMDSIESSAPLTVTPAALASITVKAPKGKIALGLSQQFTAVGTYTDNSTQDVTSTAAWKSSAPEIAPVSAGGLVSAQAVGAALVSAQVDSVQGSSPLTVGPAALVSVAVSTSRPQIPLGATQQFTAMGSYTDGTNQDISRTVSWTSVPSGIVSLTGSGSALALAKGFASVQAQLNGVSGSASVSVAESVLQTLSIASPEALIRPGTRDQLTAQGTFSDGSTRDLTSSVAWSTDATDIVTLTGGGQVLGRTAGTALILASQDGVTSSVEVKVSSAALTSITLTPSALQVPLGTASQFRAAGIYDDGSNLDLSANVTWNVLDPDVAAISPEGFLLPAKPGSTVVQAAIDSRIATATVEILPMMLNGYFTSDSDAVDSTLRVTNSSLGTQNICTMLYVFDQDQQMSECCGCVISHNGLRTLSLNKDLTSNPLTKVPSTAGSILVVPSDYAGNPACDPATSVPGGLNTAWSTHMQPYSDGNYAVSETQLSASPLTPTLAFALQAQCMFVQQLGSGQGICQCGSGD